MASLTLGQISRNSNGRRIERPYYNQSTVGLKSGFEFDSVEDIQHALSMLGIRLETPETVGDKPFARRPGRLEVTLDNSLTVSICRLWQDPPEYDAYFADQGWGLKNRDQCSHWHLSLPVIIDDTRNRCKRYGRA
jgi:hypothetical protein